MRLMPFLPALVGLVGTRNGELGLMLTASLTGADLLVEGGHPLTPTLGQELASWAETAGVARLTLGRETVVQRAAPLVVLGRARVPFPPGAFLQATEAGEAALTDAVRAALAGAGRVADLFAGLRHLCAAPGRGGQRSCRGR